MRDNRTPSRSFVAIHFLIGLARVIFYRALQRKAAMPAVPELGVPARIAEPQAWVLGRQLKRILDALFFWHPGPCYFRSYVILYVLRRAGVDLELNFGMKNPFAQKKREIRAHCWLTLNKSLFLENPEVINKYPIQAAQPRKSVVFWWGEEEGCDAGTKSNEKYLG